ncbi:MAG TPA: 8-amino-7-oxononanoate synthase [Smithellaceae bacterium]|jgi:8-amino-7-oxononanoate synthase|nr:8-amino-7-oxononanoate synthase [Syntrophaceae bacterium]HPL96499.1 8-amino-7-oxononanoate synthase [Smithellaceae bacterium]HPV48102.1 8-amino-7-oxononanoate synthase [Smithellaceae bacterium]
MTTDALFAQKISRIRQAGLYRQMKVCHSPQGARVKAGNREVLMLSSNSYLGLCTDTRLKEAARKAVEMYGTGAGGSRLISGTSPIHRELEAQVAFFKGTEDALIFSSGYMANAGVISSVADKNWVIYSDRLNHASIIDGCRLSGAQTVVYEHGDVNDLENKIRRYPSKQGLIVTDALFSVDGDLAPLPALVATARRHGLLLMVDEAHATGVLGKNGGGAAELFGIKDGIDISTGTFSKALASEGGFVAGSAALIDYLINTARSFIFSTAMPPAGAAVSLAALDIVRTEPQRRSTLMERAAWLRDSLGRAGFDVANHPTQIISLILGEPRTATTFSDRLMEKGIFVTAIRPPTVPAGTSRLRISLMATHTRADLEYAASEITAVGRELGVIGREKVST